MNTKLSKTSIYYLSDALAESIKNDVKDINSSSIALNDFKKTADDLINKLVATKEINVAFMEAHKQLDPNFFGKSK